MISSAQRSTLSMAQRLKFTSIGQGPTIVLLHGWGVNAQIWRPLSHYLQQNFKVVLIDLPGYGVNCNANSSPYDLPNIARDIVQSIDEPAIYLGWSLGGLVATQIALDYGQDIITGLITVASSPCFKEQENWRGIKPELLATFHHQISKDIESTLNTFLKIQAMGSSHIKEDIKQIHQLVMSAPLPNLEALNSGLNLLETIDLRPQLSQITLPFLRIYGKMDSLVPKSNIAQIDQLCPNSESITFAKASHAPFISNTQEFEQQVVRWLMANY